MIQFFPCMFIVYHILQVGVATIMNIFTPIRDPRFFSRNVTEVAHDLIGKKFIFHEFNGIITETEAYRGQDDEASHAYKGRHRRTKLVMQYFDNFRLQAMSAGVVLR